MFWEHSDNYSGACFTEDAKELIRKKKEEMLQQQQQQHQLSSVVPGSQHQYHNPFEHVYSGKYCGPLP